ncbi:MAG: 30S ribosomal protein S4 [Nanoarchaeota archaeon]
MGDPRKPRKKYTTPAHPWQSARIEEERGLVKEYGLVNKREVWRMRSKVKKFADQIKSLVTARSAQAKRERDQLMRKLLGYGLVKENATMDDILGLTTKDIMERRLQTLLFRKGMAKTVKQARQFIVHGHVKIGDRKITSPCYIVTKAEEGNISFLAVSPLSSSEHPERAVKA